LHFAVIAGRDPAIHPGRTCGKPAGDGQINAGVGLSTMIAIDRKPL
jgi:hypothetical protein